jgi:hypothetical protein
MAGEKILLDVPTKHPALDYEDSAKAFKDIIVGSEPNFAIGIFGGWGSGKTTLMGAIKNELPTTGILTVDFNAWRFEREPQLLIPLLDTIRGALADRAKLAAEGKLDEGEASDAPRNSEVALNLRRIAGRVGRVARALATGLSGSIGIPGAVTFNVDAGAIIDTLAKPDPCPDPSDEDIAPKSLYVAAFAELQEAFKDLDSAGVSRIVVFVDDLDRCLPASALDVLESMKLFFDLPGFIFVVGLDESVIDGAIATKLTRTVAGPRTIAADEAPVAEVVPSRQLGKEYAKKIFQVPYTLPPMRSVQLKELLESMYKEAGIEDPQLTDLKTNVRRYLQVIAVQDRVNPREVKRFINSYTLQTLIHSINTKLKPKAILEPEAILALQTLAFRPEWQPWYEAVTSQPKDFLPAIRKYRTDAEQLYDFDFEKNKIQLRSGKRVVDRERIEADFGDVFHARLQFSDELRLYLSSDLMDCLAAQKDLEPYVSSVGSVRTPEVGRPPTRLLKVSRQEEVPRQEQPEPTRLRLR